MQDRGGVLLLQRSNMLAVPDVHRVGRREIEQDDGEQRGAQEPGRAIAGGSRTGPPSARSAAADCAAAGPRFPLRLRPRRAAPGVALGRFRFLGLRRQIGLGGLGLGRFGFGADIFFVRPLFERSSVIGTPPRMPTGAAREPRGFSTCPINASEPAGFHQGQGLTKGLRVQVCFNARFDALSRAGDRAEDPGGRLDFSFGRPPTSYCTSAAGHSPPAYRCNRSDQTSDNFPRRPC